MAILDKDAYRGKAAYAARRMMDNAEVGTLTEDQHEALAWLCRVRHEMHTDTEGWVLSESGSENWVNLREIADTLARAELPAISIPEYDPWDDNDIGNEWTEPDMIEAFEEKGFDTEDLHCGLMEYAAWLGNDVNSRIEEYLQQIDEAHGTHYCPTGATRLWRWMEMMQMETVDRHRGYDIVETDWTTEDHASGGIVPVYIIPGLKERPSRPFLTSVEMAKEFIDEELAGRDAYRAELTERFEARVRAQGASLGLTIPAEIARRIGLEYGDDVEVTIAKIAKK